LQSYGLNYFVPLSQYSGLKPFVATLPFIYQFGGQLYGNDGMSTAINDEKTLEGITLMAELFTLYNIPKFVASFYNNFRYGTLPIGIGDLGTYLLLSSAATELDGLWGMDLHPGVYNEQTQTIDRDAASGAQGSMILADTNHREESWDFLSWWMSEEIQVMFGQILQTTYGKTYFWNSANVNAFARSGMPQEYKNVVLAQWEYATEASRIPGTYMVEREISNAWTNIVFNGINPRQAIDEAVRISNREIIYKMAEFGYTDRGVILKPYIVPTKETIQRWLVAHA
jgi:ABC-type glycerol-3-phosphate transport system substrate-binding protein